MLNVSSPSPLCDDQTSGNLSIDNSNKATNLSLMNTKSIRPTLNNFNQSESMSFEDNLKKTIYQYKVILIGSIAVGKTALLRRYIKNEFNSDYQCTIKSEFQTKIVNINNQIQAKLTIWDTCGDEKFKAITRQYYRDAQGILLVYDVTNSSSFDNVQNWFNDIKDNAPSDTVVILVANKTDLIRERKVTAEDGKAMAENLSLDYLEVSAKTGDNLHLLFEKLSRSMMDQIENKSNLIEKKSINEKSITGEEDKPKKFCC